MFGKDVNKDIEVKGDKLNQGGLIFGGNKGAIARIAEYLACIQMVLTSHQGNMGIKWNNLEINKRYKGQKDAFRKTSANEVSFLKFSQNIR